MVMKNRAKWKQLKKKSKTWYKWSKRVKLKSFTGIAPIISSHLEIRKLLAFIQ